MRNSLANGGRVRQPGTIVCRVIGVAVPKRRQIASPRTTSKDVLWRRSAKKKAPMWTSAVQKAASSAAACVKIGSRGSAFALEVYENLGHSHTLKAAELPQLRFRAAFARGARRVSHESMVVGAKHPD